MLIFKIFFCFNTKSRGW